MFQRDVEWSYLQWMETGVLFSLLAHGARFEIVLCFSLLHYNEPDLPKKVFPEYDPQPNDGGVPGAGVKVKYSAIDKRHFPSSIYLVSEAGSVWQKLSPVLLELKCEGTRGFPAGGMLGYIAI